MLIRCPHCGTEYDVDKSEMYRFVTCQVCGKGFVAGTVQQREASSTEETSGSGSHLFPSESVCSKAWFGYWLKRLLIVAVVSAVVGGVCGFVASVTGCIPLAAWPKESPVQMAHLGAYGVVLGGLFVIWYLSWLSYKKTVLNQQVRPVGDLWYSWLIPMVANIVLSLLMPMKVQLSVLGIYGYIVWAMTIWVAVDYCMFRFVSLRIVYGKRVDIRWLCPALLFMIFIVVIYGFSSAMENMQRQMKQLDDSRHHDAKQIYQRMQDVDDSRHNDASQIYDRMGRMKLY